MQTKDELLEELLENVQWFIESWVKEPQDHEAIVVNRILCYDTLDKLTKLEGKGDE